MKAKRKPVVAWAVVSVLTGSYRIAYSRRDAQVVAGAYARVGRGLHRVVKLVEVKR